MKMLNLSWSLNTSDRNNSGKNIFELNRYSGQELDYWTAVGVINVILSFTAVFGNSAILIAIWKTSSLHSVANILLANLAVSDLAVGLVCQPLLVVFLLTGKGIVGVLANIFVSIFCFTSFFTMLAIAVDRLLALQLHLRYKTVVTPFRATWVVISTWVFSGVFTIAKVTNARAYDIASSALTLCMLLVNFVAYFKIYLIARRHQRQIQHQQQEANNESTFSVKRFRRSVLNSFLVYIFLLCCSMPHTIAMIMYLTGVITSPRLYIATGTVVCLNSSLNPLLFCWRDREIRTAVKQLFCR